MAGLTFQGPYVYQRYLDSGIEPAKISLIMSTFNIVSSFWGFLVGHAADRLGHKKLIIVSACLLSFHGTLRYIGGFSFFVLASAVMGISTASNKVVFEDWLMTELQSPDAPELSLVTVQENSALIRLLLTLALTPISAKLTREFGSNSAFAVSSLMFFTSAFII
jgi:MFS family permease